jgi:long-chain acyl-CoA synthetase
VNSPAARFKRPKNYKFVDALSENNCGKILKTDLRSKLQAHDTNKGDKTSAARPTT